MEYQLNHRTCLSCGNIFLANNGNRYYCPENYGKKNYCKNQAKHLRDIKKRGGRTEAERQTFLKQHLGFCISKEFMEKNLFKIKSVNYDFLVEGNSHYSEFYLEGYYALLLEKETQMFHITHFSEALEINS